MKIVILGFRCSQWGIFVDVIYVTRTINVLVRIGNALEEARTLIWIRMETSYVYSKEPLSLKWPLLDRLFNRVVSPSRRTYIVAKCLNLAGYFCVFSVFTDGTCHQQRFLSRYWHLYASLLNTRLHRVETHCLSLFTSPVLLLPDIFSPIPKKDPLNSYGILHAHVRFLSMTRIFTLLKIFWIGLGQLGWKFLLYEFHYSFVNSVNLKKKKCVVICNMFQILVYTTLRFCSFHFRWNIIPG